MKLHQLRARQFFPISTETAWEFLSNPENLKTITPDHMGFEVLSGTDRKMFQGQIIQYNVYPFPGIKTRWVTEITHVEEGSYFVDEQRFGPYALWHHKHFILPVDGGIEISDIIDYKLPFGFIGNWLHPVLVKKQLKTIFGYREEQLKKLFGTLEGRSAELSFKTI